MPRAASQINSAGGSVPRVTPFTGMPCGDWTYDSSPREVESRGELDHHLATGRLCGLTLQGLALDVDPPDLRGIDLSDALFVGCRFADAAVAADIVARGGSVVPVFDDVPYPTARSRLYTPDDLAAGFSTSTGAGFEAMYDTIVYRHFTSHGGALPDVREALAQRMHDTGIDNALIDVTNAWTSAHGAASVVGIMGGHGQRRGSPAYRLAASLAHRLAGAGRLVVTGGGPGVMEAANLGAFLRRRPADELSAAIDVLASAPDFRDHDPYTGVALALRDAYANAGDGYDHIGASRLHRHDGRDGRDDLDRLDRLATGGLAIPTWLYGHEPANLFAGGIAKYFSNAIREDMILRLARGGIVFAPGRAGTVQEVFQAATKAYYHTDGPSGAFVFLDTAYWTTTVPVEALLRPLLASSPRGDLSGLIHVTDDVSEAVRLLTGG